MGNGIRPYHPGYAVHPGYPYHPDPNYQPQFHQHPQYSAHMIPHHPGMPQEQICKF